MGYTTRFTKLLGECRRQMNGAVADSMRYYGAKYGLNYGVSLPTIRSLALEEGQDHSYARYLYLQEVREIRLAALHIAEPMKINSSELKYWGDGIINSEIAEEAAFALFQHVDCICEWLTSKSELLIYTALLSLSKGCRVDLKAITSDIHRIAQSESLLTTTAVVTLLERYYRDTQNRAIIAEILGSLPPSKTTDHIRSEMVWRCEEV